MPLRLPPTLLPGREEPLGALARDGGVNFAVFSQHAQRVEVCVFDANGATELRRYALCGPHDGVWSGFLPGAGPGLVYGLRAHGPYAPEQGHRFNPHKLLLDPNAREIVGRFTWAPEHHGYELGHPEGPRSFDTRDNAVAMLKARVAAPPQPAPGWHNAPRLPARDVVLYEMHVKGFSMTLPGIPDELRGSYAALAHPAALAHFKALGVTTLSLLPVHYHLDEAALVARGQVNYWGYNTLAFNCPDPRFASAAVHKTGDPAAVNQEFRQMVHALHEAGLEVVLDVVYNHTAEGDQHGTTLSFRGLDHASWYKLAHHDRSRCENLSGCGNTLNVAHPRVTQFVLDSLRYWVLEMGVDGFRFDLAPVLGRGHHGYDPHAAFFTALMQDPVLARARMIAEPWDAGHAGYQLGRFPGRWLEWNDKFRDTARRYWLGARVGRGEFARRFTASSDVFHHGQRSPLASVNFIAVHDGFTLADFTSYARKHNEANGEDNRDGRDDEICDPLNGARFGATSGLVASPPEGPSPDPTVTQRRERVRRALLATLLLAQGTPMLCAGDELSNTQGGNNNAYCQDNEVGWLNWAQADKGLQDYVAELLALRRAEPALRHDQWFHVSSVTPGERTLTWFNPSGAEMHVHDWHDGGQHAFACRIDARVMPVVPVAPGATLVPGQASAQGQEGSRHLLIAFNPEPTPLPFTLPPGPWALCLDSSGQTPSGPVPGRPAPLNVPAHALLVLRGVD
jgi:glycogen operon protein